MINEIFKMKGKEEKSWSCFNISGETNLPSLCRKWIEITIINSYYFAFLAN